MFCFYVVVKLSKWLERVRRKSDLAGFNRLGKEVRDGALQELLTAELQRREGELSQIVSQMLDLKPGTIRLTEVPT